VFFCIYAATNPMLVLHPSISLPALKWALSPGNTLGFTKGIFAFLNIHDPATVLGFLLNQYDKFGGEFYELYGKKFLILGLAAYIFEFFVYVYRLIYKKDRLQQGIEVHLIWAAVYVIVVSRYPIAGSRFAFPAVLSLCFLSAIFVQRSIRVVTTLFLHDFYVLDMQRFNFKKYFIMLDFGLPNHTKDISFRFKYLWNTEKISLNALLLLLGVCCWFMTEQSSWLINIRNRFTPEFYTYVKYGIKQDIQNYFMVKAADYVKNSFCVGARITSYSPGYAFIEDFMLRRVYTTQPEDMNSLVQKGNIDVVVLHKSVNSFTKNSIDLLTQNHIGLKLYQRIDTDTYIFARKELERHHRGNIKEKIAMLNRYCQFTENDIIQRIKTYQVFTKIGQDNFSLFNLNPIQVGGHIQDAIIGEVVDILEIVPRHYQILVFKNSGLPRIIFDPHSGSIIGYYKVFYEGIHHMNPKQILQRYVQFVRDPDYSNEFIAFTFIFRQYLWKDNNRAVYMFERQTWGSDFMIYYGDKTYLQECVELDQRL
ncbi:MAG: hypothetical protein HQK77_04255, partial [Desulfobacterales bacterium]|nr:hypothetical protein [Desulfobacterales bacterium]